MDFLASNSKFWGVVLLVCCGVIFIATVVEPSLDVWQVRTVEVACGLGGAALLTRSLWG